MTGALLQKVFATVGKNSMMHESIIRGVPKSEGFEIELRALGWRLQGQGWRLRTISQQVGSGRMGTDIRLA